ncbi:MAG: hypothetical protein Q9222_003368 [Ikaeria aurantiellina]
MASEKPPRGDAFASKIFSVYAGPTRKRFLVHAGILSASPILGKMVSGGWNECTDCSINLEEWEENTVAQVLQWLYQGFYTWPFIPDELEDDSQAQVADPTATSSETKQPDQAFTRTEKIECHGPRKFTGNLEKVTQNHPIDEIRKTLLLSSKNAATLLPDAKVYVLANYLQLVELKRLAFHNIQDVLCGIELEKSNSSTLASIPLLIEYAYANTDSLVNEEEPLRNLLSSFTAGRLIKVNESSHIRWTVAGEEFIVDLLKKLQRALVNARTARKIEVKALNAQFDQEKKELNRQIEGLKDKLDMYGLLEI